MDPKLDETRYALEQLVLSLESLGEQEWVEDEARESLEESAAYIRDILFDTAE